MNSQLFKPHGRVSQASPAVSAPGSTHGDVSESWVVFGDNVLNYLDDNRTSDILSLLAAVLLRKHLAAVPRLPLVLRLVALEDDDLLESLERTQLKLSFPNHNGVGAFVSPPESMVHADLALRINHWQQTTSQAGEDAVDDDVAAWDLNRGLAGRSEKHLPHPQPRRRFYGDDMMARLSNGETRRVRDYARRMSGGLTREHVRTIATVPPNHSGGVLPRRRYLALLSSLAASNRCLALLNLDANKGTVAGGWAPGAETPFWETESSATSMSGSTASASWTEAY